MIVYRENSIRGMLPSVRSVPVRALKKRLTASLRTGLNLLIYSR